MPLRVTIVGGGLAGLISARVLREHHEVTVLERYSGNPELGAAINMGPSAVKILRSLKFDVKRCGSIVADSSRVFDKSGKNLQMVDMSAFSRAAGADWIFQHRVDLWTEFYHLATAPSDELSISGSPAKVITNAEVVNVNVDSGDVELADGTVLQSDLIVGADGIKSIIRPLVIDQKEFETARPSGTSAFRFLMPANEALTQMSSKGGSFANVLDTAKPASLDVYIATDGSSRSVVIYPVRNFELLNFVCIAPDSLIKTETSESWSAVGTREDLLDTYHDFDYLQPLLSGSPV